jgi:hypothetical protein
MENITLLTDFLKQLEKSNLIDLKISDKRLALVANNFLTGQPL